jgi:hypothetical protein
MPPRYAYWTILVDDQPTAFRAALQEDLMPTFKRLKERNPSAKMMWWQNGKLWNSRLDAQEAMRARGEIGRRNDSRQSGFRDRDRSPDRGQRPERNESGKLDWKPKGDFPSDRERQAPRNSKPEGRVRRSAEREGGRSAEREGGRSAEREGGKPSRPRSEKLEWKPKGEGLAPRDHLLRRNIRENAKPGWKPKGAFSRPQDLRTTRPPAGKPRAPRDGKLEWRPKGEGGSQAPNTPPHAPKRQWLPKEEYKKAQGIEVPRDKKWRPGGEHRDPRQKYKDAKKAKWGRFKQNIRQKWEAKQTGGKKKRGDE